MSTLDYRMSKMPKVSKICHLSLEFPRRRVLPQSLVVSAQSAIYNVQYSITRTDYYSGGLLIKHYCLIFLSPANSFSVIGQQR